MIALDLRVISTISEWPSELDQLSLRDIQVQHHIRFSLTRKATVFRQRRS